MTLAWTDALANHVSLINKDHQELMRILGGFEELVEKGCDNRNLGAFLGRLAEYAGMHFKREEWLMLQSKFPRYSEHKRQHGVFLDRLATIIYGFEFGQKASSGELAELLKDWLCDHFLVADVEFEIHLVDKYGVQVLGALNGDPTSREVLKPCHPDRHPPSLREFMPG